MSLPPHLRDLAHEAGVMQARLDLLRAAAKGVLEWLNDEAPFGAGDGIRVSADAPSAIAALRRAVNRAALPIESPEVPDAAS